MAKNEVHDNGQWLDVPVPAGVLSGHAVAVGSLVGVAQNDRQADGRCTINTRGVHNLAVADATTVGAVLYAVVSGGLVTSLTTTVGTNIRFGYALDVQAGAGTIRVKVGY